MPVRLAAAARLLYGELERPSPAVVLALLTYHTRSLTVMFTVPVALFCELPFEVTV